MISKSLPTLLWTFLPTLLWTLCILLIYSYFIYRYGEQHREVLESPSTDWYTQLPLLNDAVGAGLNAPRP